MNATGEFFNSRKEAIAGYLQKTQFLKIESIVGSFPNIPSPKVLLPGATIAMRQGTSGHNRAGYSVRQTELSIKQAVTQYL